MVGVLILTHGELAEELLAAARKIAGPLEQFEALPLEWSDGLDEAHRKVSRAIERLDSGDGVLVLVDIFGGTPSNAAMAFVEEGKVDVVSGVNLPMVVRLGCLGLAEMPLAELTSWIREKGRDSICCGSETPTARRQPATAPDADC
ncbi:MAG: hypothetical protein MPN21_08200 [Thermoanaerobaculia bacterium]|nr:hypothetical protein [Thermoanaerobaculia bacterium]